MNLTRRQREIYNFIKEYTAGNECSPTLDEIARHFGIASLNAIYKHLNALEQRGFLRRLSNQARSIRLLDPDQPAPCELPLLGIIAAGEPIEAVANCEYISVPEWFASPGRKNYVLRVRGNSMIEEHIEDGDYVIVEERADAANGEMVVALIDGENVTLKKFYREGAEVRLQPANVALEPIRLGAERVRLQGVVVGVLRKYK